MNKHRDSGHVIKANDSDHEDAYQVDHFNHAPTHNEAPSFMNVPESKKKGTRVAMTKPSLPMGIHSKRSSEDHREKDFLHDMDHAEPFQPPVQGFNESMGSGLHPKPLKIADHLISDNHERPGSPNMFNLPESTMSE